MTKRPCPTPTKYALSLATPTPAYTCAYAFPFFLPLLSFFTHVPCPHMLPTDPRTQSPPPFELLIHHLINSIQILIQNLVHGKHVNAVLLEDGTHGIIASNLALVVWILEIARFDVFPYLLHRLRPRELRFAEEVRERGGEGHWFLGRVRLHVSW